MIMYSYTYITRLYSIHLSIHYDPITNFYIQRARVIAVENQLVVSKKNQKIKCYHHMYPIVSELLTEATYETLLHTLYKMILAIYTQYNIIHPGNTSIISNNYETVWENGHIQVAIPQKPK